MDSQHFMYIHMNVDNHEHKIIHGQVGSYIMYLPRHGFKGDCAYQIIVNLQLYQIDRFYWWGFVIRHSPFAITHHYHFPGETFPASQLVHKPKIVVNHSLKFYFFKINPLGETCVSNSCFEFFSKMVAMCVVMLLLLALLFALAFV